jgi:hypothetical protein
MPLCPVRQTPRRGFVRTGAFFHARDVFGLGPEFDFVRCINPTLFLQTTYAWRVSL